MLSALLDPECGSDFRFTVRSCHGSLIGRPTASEGNVTMEVRTKYTFQSGFGFDQVAGQAAGRAPDFSGCGFGERDLGWTCKSEFEAERIKRALDKVGLRAEIVR